MVLDYFYKIFLTDNTEDIHLLIDSGNIMNS